jgi:hypothetical protein
MEDRQLVKGQGEKGPMHQYWGVEMGTEFAEGTSSGCASQEARSRGLQGSNPGDSTRALGKGRRFCCVPGGLDGLFD